MEQSTKIVGGLSDFKEEKKSEKSLLQRINESTTKKDVEYLLGVGGTYKKASSGTLRKWSKAASKKLESFKV